jgi:hypothetical protein
MEITESVEVSCKDCNCHFQTRNQLASHMKKTHQHIFKINYRIFILSSDLFVVNSTTTIDLHNCEQTVFNCDQCNSFSCDHPMKLQRHVYLCNAKYQTSALARTTFVDTDICSSIKQYSPVHSDYVTDGRLKELQLYIHKKLQFVYCAVCQVGILFDALHTHMSRSHGHSIIVGELLNSFSKLMNSTRKPINDPKDERIKIYYDNPMDPINGIGVSSGFKCLMDECNYCCSTKGTLGNHFRTEHPKMQKKFESCDVQHIFSFPKIYVKVSNSKIEQNGIIIFFFRWKKITTPTSHRRSSCNNEGECFACSDTARTITAS